ncbi:MAG TPA: CdaR family protein [Candidatus Nitrosocosmicus sp.]|nr:CdaR family protein [Candidatus Nitrosocosmicus sp.]
MNDKFLNKDITIRVLSVMLALLLWFYVITEQNPEITKDVTIPVRLINAVFLEKNSMVLANDPNNFKLTLRLKGKKDILDKLNETTIEATADLEGHRVKGENYLKININGIPEDVNILAKSPESLKVVLEHKVSVQKGVQINIMGNPSHGLAAMTPMIVPNDVVITGSESSINKINSVRVDVDIASVNSEVKKILPVRVLDENGKDIQNIIIEPSNVEVSIPIENTNRAAIEMDLAGQPAAGYVVSSISVFPEEILVTGKQQALQGINSLKTEKIDITEGTADISREVKLVLPEGIELVNANEKISIFVNIEKITTTEITAGSIEYVNLPEGLELDSIQGGMKVSLRGAESLLTDASSTIKFYVDLKHANEGTNVLNVLWETPQGVEVVSVSPPQATVVLRKSGR